jgi:decaprenylphospho-beta-D-ribofuranose 2-oxidase
VIARRGDEPADDRLLTGWGGTAPSRAHVIRPLDADAIRAALTSAGRRGVLPRGLGRSYGDVAQNAGGVVMDLTGIRGVERIDAREGEVEVLAGTSFDELLRAIVPRGWFLPVTPGTRFVTVGGAIANDVHGKNHHVDGALGRHLSWFDLMLADGDVRRVAASTDPELFGATLGGLGLTGVVLRAGLRLIPIETSSVRVDTERATDLDDLMARMSSGDERYRYSVAWLDALAAGAHLGRGVLTRGDHAMADELPDGVDPLRYRPRSLLSVPAQLPNVVTRTGVRAFNELWFRKAPREERDRVIPLTAFFHPLDAIGDWNRVYGRRGFVQHQSVVPFGAEEVVRTAVGALAAARVSSFLAVLKRFGAGSGWLSFPIGGWTLALDMPVGHAGLAGVLDAIDREVADAGGRVYLAKDGRLDPELVPTMYPDLDRWREVRARVDPSGVLRSDLDRRLDLDDRKEGTA